MKLYHYSSTLYPVLLTRRRQQPLSETPPGGGRSGPGLTTVEYEHSKKVADEYSDVGSYYDHVSFFFEPLPLDKLGKHFDNGHDFWFDGHLIYEHVIDTARLPKDMRFDVVEVPWISEWWEQHGFADSAPKQERLKVFAKLRKAKEATGDVGFTRRALEAKIKQYDHGVMDYYLRQKASPRWEEGRAKYAAGVPHVMIYSEIGRFEVSSVSSCVIGSNQRKDFSSVLKQFNYSSTW